MEVLLLVVPLFDILVGKHGMLPLIAHGRKISKKWQGKRHKTTN
jgi:hypothetical protein